LFLTQATLPCSRATKVGASRSFGLGAACTREARTGLADRSPTLPSAADPLELRVATAFSLSPAFFLESIFIDQGSLNGNRPGHPQMPTRPDLPSLVRVFAGPCGNGTQPTVQMGLANTLCKRGLGAIKPSGRRAAMSFEGSRRSQHHVGPTGRAERAEALTDLPNAAQRLDRRIWVGRRRAGFTPRAVRHAQSHCYGAICATAQFVHCADSITRRRRCGYV
jgi:hypothetical protein